MEPLPVAVAVKQTHGQIQRIKPSHYLANDPKLPEI